jgi:hemoglobin-like flavoprotein
LAVNAREMEIVRGDWEKVEPLGDAVGTLFYERLFALDPGARSLFPADMAEQKQKLARMIGAAVYGLDDPEVLGPILQLLGRKHARLGVSEQHYETVGTALLWTLRQGLGEAFGPENEAAWASVYRVLANEMQAPGLGLIS